MNDPLDNPLSPPQGMLPDGSLDPQHSANRRVYDPVFRILAKQWHLQGDFDKHISTWHMEFRHGRHRPRSNQQVRLVAGIWCRPGRTVTWEPINREDHP